MAVHWSSPGAQGLGFKLLMFAKYSDNVFCSGDVSPRRVADLNGDLVAEKRRWGHRRYSRGRDCILRVSLNHL